MKDSSFIKEITWKEGNLFVRLKTDKFYEYKNVPKNVYEDFMNSESHGKFFDKNIKNRYEYVKDQTVNTIRGGISALPKSWETLNKKLSQDLSNSGRWPFPSNEKP